MAPSEHALLKQVYDAFNARDIEAVLSTLHPQVDWPNGWEGGRIHGRSAVRAYWTRQWEAIAPHVEPVGFHADGPGRTMVDVHAVVCDRQGNVIADEMIQHIYVIEDGLILSLEIRKPRRP
jgi:hypothetical protein